MNELLIELDSGCGIPLYEQIYNFIVENIRSGKIGAHDKLPSTRSLAGYLSVSRSTVELSYEQLLSEGYIEAVPYKGYYACDFEELQLSVTTNRSMRIFDDRKSENEDAGDNDLGLIDFSPYGVDVEHFPYAAWRKIFKTVMQDDPKWLLQSGSSKGDLPLRKAISDYLYHSRGVNCDPEQILVGAGNDFLEMILSMIIDKNSVIALENPTYRQAYKLFSGLGFRVKTVNMDKAGMKEEELNNSGAQIAYVMPSHQYPTGVVMPMKRRLELLKWASKSDSRYIIEDDYDSEFRYVGKPIPALAGYDKSGKVIYLGSLSKAIAPGFRFSYMVLPPELMREYEKKCSHLSCPVSRIEQAVLAEFMNSGSFGRHLNKMRSIYRSKHDVLLEELKNCSSKIRISGANAGLHLLVEVLSGKSEEMIMEEARKQGVAVYGLSKYYIHPVEEDHATILLGYANMTEEKIKEGVQILDKVFG